jgi:hypothetical protein
MLIRCVIDDQFGDAPKIATVRLVDKGLEIRHTAERGMDVLVIGDVVAVVAQSRGIERQQPQSRLRMIMSTPNGQTESPARSSE